MSDNAVAIRPEDTFLQLAIEKDMDLDKLQKLIEMRNAEITRVSKTEYDKHFAEMQRDYVPVMKDKTALDGAGKKMYAYCPLETILQVYQPIITRHGFSYRWNEEGLQNSMKRIWCIVAGYGHEERSYVDIPIIEGNRMTNSVQQRGSATSYGKRYSFINAFGVVIAGEDDDAQGGQPPKQRPPEEPSKDPKQAAEWALHEEIMDLRKQFADTLMNPKFSDDDRKIAKAKIEIGQGNTVQYRDYVQSIITEYEGRLKKKQPEDDAKPAEDQKTTKAPKPPIEGEIIF